MAAFFKLAAMITNHTKLITDIVVDKKYYDLYATDDLLKQLKNMQPSMAAILRQSSSSKPTWKPNLTLTLQTRSGGILLSHSTWETNPFNKPNATNLFGPK